MRRVESEGESLGGNRGPKRGKGRPGASPSRSHLRRLSLETLESRQLLASNLPSATIAPGTAGTLIFGIQNLSANQSSPTVAVDPTDPTKLVAAWVSYDPAHPSGNRDVTAVVDSAYSVDGGRSWSLLTQFGDLIDFSQDQKTAPHFFTQTTDPKVGFDRYNNAYILTDTHRGDNAAGTLLLDRFNFANASATNAPVQNLFGQQVYAWDGNDALSAPSMAIDANVPSFTDVDSRGNPRVQVDPYAGNVYVSWSTTDTNRSGNAAINPFNPNSIKVVASSDQGQTFTHAAFVDNLSNANFGASHSNPGGTQYAQPTLAVSQGRPATATSPAIPGGQVTIVYEDFGTLKNVTVPANKGFDQILDQTNYVGGTSATFQGPVGGINNALKAVAPSTSDTPVATDFPIQVAITDPKFATLQALDVRLALGWPNLQELSAQIIPPRNSGLGPVYLFLNGINADGTTNMNTGLTGSLMGVTQSNEVARGPETVFDSEAIRSIRDNSPNYVGHYLPEAGNLAAYRGATAAQLAGQWTLRIVDYRNDTAAPPAPRSLFDFSLNFSSGNNPGFNPAAGRARPEVTVADPFTFISTALPVSNPLNPAAAAAQTYAYNDYTTGVSNNPATATRIAVQAQPVLPSPSVAVDNTLGAYSQHQGRIYVAYTGRYDDYLATPKDITEILLIGSDDGGQTWFAIDPGKAASQFPATSTGVQVNDDLGARDGFSEGSLLGITQPNGRPKLNPQVAVDQSTGTVVVSFLDARNDASRARVATYVAVSNDGGNSFSPETFANPSSVNPSSANLDGAHPLNPAPIIDAITGKVAAGGPAPDNQSGGNGFADPVFGFGTQMGLAVADGTIVPVWASNQNLGTPLNKVGLSIVSSVMTTAGGPRILSSTMGPVGQPGDTVNTTRGADGSPVANSFLVSFDRPIDPATFQGDGPTNPPGTGGVRVFYQDPYGSTLLAMNTPVPTSVGGTTSSSLSTSGHPGEPIVDARLNLSLSGIADTSRLVVALVAPNGQAFFVPVGADPRTTANAVNGSFAFPANMVGGVLDGTYRLYINDPSGQPGGVLNSWSLQLNGVSTPLRVLGVAPVPNLFDPQDDGTLGYTQFRVLFAPVDPATGVATGVGTYSYVIRPGLSDRIRTFANPLLSPGVFNLAVTGPGTATSPTTGINTSAVVVSGHPGQFLLPNVNGNGAINAPFPGGNVAGTVTATIVVSGANANSSTLEVYLSTPDGKRYLLGPATLGNNNTLLTLSAAPFTIPYTNVSLDGTYTLEVVDTAVPATQSIGIGVFQLSLNGELQTPNQPAPAVVAAAQPPQVPLPLNGTNTTTSSITLVAHPGKTIVGGQVGVTLTDTNVADLTLTLIGPTGQTFVLPGSFGTALSQSFSLPASFAGLPIDGTYRLVITGRGGDTGLLTAFSIALTPNGPNGNAMDQNADGAPGQDPESAPFTGATPGDDYAVPTPNPTSNTTAFGGSSFPGGPYSPTTLPLIVPGPHIIATNVTGTGGSTTGNTADGLVTNDQVNTVAVTFDRNVQITSVQPNQVLNLLGPAGPISTPQFFASSGTSKSFASTDVGKAIPKATTVRGTTTNGSVSSVLPIFNTGLNISSLRVQLNITDPNDSSLVIFLLAPDGKTLIRLASQNGGTGANFTNTTFSDTPPANGAIGAIAAGRAPFSLTYQPVDPLGVLANTPLDGFWQLLIFDTTTAGAQGRLNSWSLDVTPQVPRAAGSSLTSSLTVANPDKSFTIDHLAVQLNITAPVASDVTAVLVGPDGTKYGLFSGVGGTGSNFSGTVLDDNAFIPIGLGVAPFNQAYIPADVPNAAFGFNTLNSLRGKPIDGTWNLILVDRAGATAPVTLNSWALIATPQVKVAPLQVYTSTDTSAQSYASTDVGRQVYASVDVTQLNPAAIPTGVGQSVSSTIHFTPGTPGAPFLIQDLQVALSLTYPRDSNLAVALTAPNGATIPLFAAVGGTGANFGGPFNYTVLSDGGTIPIAAGAAPFASGSILNPTTIYRPSASLLAALRGLALNAGSGAWTLTVTNGQRNGPAGGTFNGWALVATPTPAPAAAGLPVGSLQPAEPIPVVSDSSPQPLVSTITFASTGGAFTLGRLDATLTIASPNLANLTGILVAPDGVQQTLFAAGTSTALGGTSPLTLTFANLINFANLPVDGTWQLRLSDGAVADGMTGGAGGGTLVGWSLAATPRPVALGQAPEPIPATPASLLTSTITIPDDVPISNLRLRLNLSAPKDSNLVAVLVGPDGQVIRLFANVGGNGVNFANTVFDDNAPAAIGAGAAPFSGTFRPLDPLGVFAYKGTTTRGVWKLAIAATTFDGTQAVLNSWSLINTPPPSATLANTYQLSFPTQQLSGTYTLTVGSGIQAAAPSSALGNPASPADPTLGTPANPNLNAGVDVLRGTSASGVVATAGVTYNATAVPVAIPAGSTTRGVTTPGVLSSQVLIPDNFLIQGVIQGPNGLTLPGVTLQLNITYPNDPDLSAVLIAPDGKTRISLFTNVGNGANRANFNGTIFDDTVNPLAPIDSAGNGFQGRFNPETPLSNLAGLSTGVNGGVFTLQITNRGTSTGSLNSWSLTFQKPLPTSGLGDPVADRQSVSFRIFNIAPTNPLANDTWTAVGPAGITTTQGLPNTFAGPVATVAYDPSDPTRNTVYVGAASGGIWKTSNFLTTNPAGPTYVPLTDFGPNFGLNIGGIAAVGRNNDPSQTIVLAGTGFAQATTSYRGDGVPFNDIGGTAGRGVGLIRSYDGGLTFTLLDSTVNVDSNGYPLPESSPLRDHYFVGDTTYKVLIDPTPQPNGQYIAYAALGGHHGGLFRSLDTGNTWQRLSNFADPNNLGNSAAATDIIFDPNSKSPTTGNLDIVYAAFQGLGVFVSTNRGLGLTAINGQLGSDPLLTDAGLFPPPSLVVGNASVTPNTPQGRIVLAKPALTGNAAVDLLYQDWIYAAVEGGDGRFNGLYVTKDRGQNWTSAKLLNVPTPTSAIGIAIPTNDQTQGTYDTTANQTTGLASDHINNGNYSMTLTVDPLNPNIVYLGGTSNFQTTGLVRVDLTNLFDAHNFTSFDNSRKDGGQLQQATVGAVQVATPQLNPVGAVYPATAFGPTPYLNLRHAPNTGQPGTSPFNVNATLVIFGAASSKTVGATDFTNDGTGVRWTAFDEALKANAGDLTGSTNLHGSIAFVDPLTGNVRLVFADDQGVFTALVNADGTLNNGIGNAASANYSRNGNLQNTQFYYGAAQPSNLAAQAAGALFYGSGIGTLAAQSDPNILNNGNLTWDNSAVLSAPPTSPRTTLSNNAIGTSDRGGVRIATDPTGGTTLSNPIGTGPAVYEYNVPSLGGNLSDFFRVNGVGHTTGLDTSFRTEFPFGNYHYSATSGNDGSAPGQIYSGPANGIVPLGNFVVNPLNGSQILISSTAGTLYESVTKGVQFFPIGTATDFGQAAVPPGSATQSQAYASALAYGAPDFNAPLGAGNLNNFIYVGTVAGGLFVTQTGGAQNNGQGGWVNKSAGLDGSTIVGIYPSPNQNSHEAYVVTIEGVFYSPDSITTPWTNITGNLTQIQHVSLGNPALAESRFSTFGAVSDGTPALDQTSSLQYGGFRSIVADYRYAIPDLSGAVHPVLYVAGYGGVFRSLDNGQTWSTFPNTSFDSAPVDGGYLPSVEVTDLQLNLGAINPATGRPVLTAGDPAVLLATTFGRGAFAIRLAPAIFPGSIGLDPRNPAPTGSASGTAYGNPNITNVRTPFIDGISEISNFGNVVTITIFDQSIDPATGKPRIDPATGKAPIIGVGTTNAIGQFSQLVNGVLLTGVQIVNTGNDPSFFLDGVKTIGIQANDSSGSRGNITTFTYTLKGTAPLAPGMPVLEAASDSGRSQTDRVTNVTNPTFDVTTTEPGTTTVQLLRSNSINGPYTVVASAPAGRSPVRLTDTNLFAIAQTGPINLPLFYETIQIDQAGNASLPSPVEDIFVNDVPPPAPTSIFLDPSTNSGPAQPPLITKNPNPLFDAGGVLPGDQLALVRSSPSTATQTVGYGAVGSNQVMDVIGVQVDGTYTYQVVQLDLAGNISPLSPALLVTINRRLPAAPTINILPSDDSGAPQHPEITNVRTPHLFGSTPAGSGTAGYRIDILNQATGQILATTAITNSLTYGTQITSPLPDGLYNFVARITDNAGNQNYSTPLTLTIKATGPLVIPSLTIAAADDTGIKGDGVTANRTPRFIGSTDPGATVKLYAIVNGSFQLQATTTASTVNGSFTLRLPNALTDGNAQLVAQASDVAGNVGPFGPVLNLRIVTVAGDYNGGGAAQLTVFRPVSTGGVNDSETYFIRNVGTVQSDNTPGRDIPVQYDFDGDGKIDPVAYRFNSAEYNGFRTTQGAYNQPAGLPGVGLPVSGYYTGNGTLNLAEYRPFNSTWYINTPNPGGTVYSMGLPNVDIPVPAAYDGRGLTEIAMFRPINTGANDGDTFTVHAAAFNYTIPFSGVAGFTYKVGDIPAPGDYDGVGHDEFAVFRPSTDQFFILNTPNVFDVRTWSLRTVSLNVPGANVGADQPASQDYDSNGRIDPTVFRPGNSTFYVLHSSSGVQEAIQFGIPGVDMAAAGPLLYRLSALRGVYATGDGYPVRSGNTSYGPPSNLFGGGQVITGGGGGGNSGGQAIVPNVATTAPIVGAPVGMPPTVSAQALNPAATTTMATTTTPPAAVPVATTGPKSQVVVGAKTPRVNTVADVASKAGTTTVGPRRPTAKATKATVKVVAKSPTPVTGVGHPARPKPTPSRPDHVAAALRNLGSIKKGQRHV